MTTFLGTSSFQPTLVGWFEQRTDSAPGLRVAAVLGIAVLTAVGAQLSVPLPFTPVPFTIQPLIVLLGGAALGARLGAYAQIVYLVAGIAGLPMFAASGTLPPGLLRLLGPTGGYLLSYPAAAAVTGYLAERGFDRRYVSQVIAMGAGLLVLYVGGVGRLAFGPPAPLGTQAALVAGFYPFILADLVKIGAGATLLPQLWRFLRSDSRSAPERS